MAQTIHLPIFPLFANRFFVEGRPRRRRWRARVPIGLGILGLLWSATVFAGLAVNPFGRITLLFPLLSPTAAMDVHFIAPLVAVAVAVLLTGCSLAVLRFSRAGRWGMILAGCVMVGWSISSLAHMMREQPTENDPPTSIFMTMPPLDGFPSLRFCANHADISQRAWPVADLILLGGMLPGPVAANFIDLFFGLAIIILLILPMTSVAFSHSRVTTG